MSPIYSFEPAFQLINIEWDAYTQANKTFPGKLQIKTFLICRCGGTWIKKGKRFCLCFDKNTQKRG
jgi:hypothetical protein